MYRYTEWRLVNYAKVRSVSSVPLTLDRNFEGAGFRLGMEKVAGRLGAYTRVHNPATAIPLVDFLGAVARDPVVTNG